MKTCPRCGKAYPDTETFCEIDGTALTASGGAARSTTMMADDQPPAPEASVECPVCGGRAQPGEVICNFCGTRLAADPVAAPSKPAAPATGSPTRVSPEAFVPATDRPSGAASRPSAANDQDDDDDSSGRGIYGILGFTLAAVVALAVGAWFAIYLSHRPATPPIAQSSPSPAATSAPEVMLAKSITIQTSGALAGTLERDTTTLAQVFDGNKAGLDNVYEQALKSDATLDDGMMVRLHIMPDGSVSDASVLTSTAPSPSLDAEVVKAVTAWKFAPTTGTGIDADYPIIFATSDAATATLEPALTAKLASLDPNEAPEYALAPSAAPSPQAIPPSPEVASVPSPIAPAIVPSAAERAPAKHHATRAPARPPRPPLVERVNNELAANRKLRRVQAYTSGSNVTLFGKVFDDADKATAERTVRGVSGVTSVTNNLTTDTSVWAQNANRINQQLQSAGLTGVTVKVIGNNAYLDGDVKTALDRERAVTITQGAAPVTVRTNLVRVVPGNIFGF